MSGDVGPGWLVDFASSHPYTRAVGFRDRLFATLRAVGPVLEEPGILIIGSEVPNLLQPAAAATLDGSGEMGDRDLLVALALLMMAGPDDLLELETSYRRLRPELRHAARSHLTILSLMEPRVGMPDPRAERGRVARLLGRLEAGEGDLP